MTELIWDGKYDENGKKVAPLRIALPFQTVETVNESAAERDRSLSLFEERGKTEWRNRLIWGDKKYVLPSLLPEFAGKVNLIYIDPPFDTGANFSYMATVPDDPDEDAAGITFTKEPSIIEQKAYRDTWGKGLDSYLEWFYETAVLLRELLTEEGSVYVHLDYHVAHYAKIVLDEVFAPGNFRSEIVWKRISAKNDSTQGAKGYPINYDVILLYSKCEQFLWRQLYTDLSEDYQENFYKYIEEGTGRRYRLGDLTAPGRGTRGHPKYEFLGVTRFWRYSREKMELLHTQGRIVQSKPGAVPALKRYLDESQGQPVQTIWTDIPPVQGQANERMDYPTQKPEALLERIIEASSNEGDLVLDCFCGSGTTAAAAEKLGRRWITCDLGRFAIHTTRKRLLGIDGVKPFVVQNLGKYERQQWQAAEFGERAQEVQQSYREFILSLYYAKAITGYVWLHGLKKGRMVHVGGVDAPISTGDVAQIALEFRKARGTGKDAPTENGVDILGWDFAFEMNEVAAQQAALAGINVRFLKIPREVLEKKAVEQGDIKFFELAALDVGHKVVERRQVQLTLKNFVIPTDDVPEEVQRAITHWEQWIDYWAVDWDNKGDTFHNQWQDYRTRKKKTLQKQIVSPADTYKEPGEYRIVVKVIDILGNDTTKTMSVTIP